MKSFFRVILFATVAWISIMLSGLFSKWLFEGVDFSHTIRQRIEDWPFLIYFYGLMLIAAVIWEVFGLSKRE